MTTTGVLVSEVAAGWARGWSFVPLNGKIPTQKGWQARPRETLDEALSWARSGNVGLRTGKASNVFVIDIDVDKGADPVFLDNVVTVTAGRGDNRHLYFRMPDVPLGNSSGKLGPHIDTRGDGGQVVFPGSIHPETQMPYVWILSPDDIELADLPGDIIEKLRAAPPPPPSNGEHRQTGGLDLVKRAAAWLAKRPGAIQGQSGDAHTFSTAASLVNDFGLSQEQAWPLLLEWNAACTPPWQESDLRQKLENAASYAKSARGCKADKPPPPRATRAKDQTSDVIERPEPLRLAEHYLEAKHRHATQALTLRRWHAENILYDGRSYGVLSDEALDADLYSHLDSLWTFKRNTAGVVVQDAVGKPVLVKLVPRKNMVNEVRAAIPSRGAIIGDGVEAPAWLDGRTEPQPRNLLVCRNCLVDLATGQRHPHTPHLLSMNALTFDYKADAPEPEHWLTFLHSLWGDDREPVDTLQEWCGYVLTPWTALQKILLVVGPKRSGKGTIGRTLAALLGSHNVAGPTLGSLTQDFGLAPLVHKPLAIISDARLSGRADQAIVTERLLSISGEDNITVDIKYRDPWTGRLPTRIMILTNELPRLNDSSGALASRFIVLTMTRSFYGQEDHGLEDRLMGELPGILNWAIAGWRRLRDRGRFIQPASSTEAMEELEQLSSPIGAFVAERCRVEAGFSVEAQRLYDAWCQWCEASGRDKPGTIQTFGRDLRAAIPGLKIVQPRDDAGRRREYEGIGLVV